MDNNYNGFTPNNDDMQQPVNNDVNAYQQQYGAAPQYAAPAPTPTENFTNQIANDLNAAGTDGTVAVAKKKSKLPFILGGSLVAVAGVGALLFAFVAPVKNWVKLTFMKPEKYFASVEEQAFTEYSTTLSEAYGEVINLVNSEGTSVDYNVEMTFGEQFMEILKEDNPDMPEFTLESIGMDMSIASNSDAASADLGVTLNGESVVSAELIYDLAEMIAYVQIPELSEAYMTASLEEYMDQIEAEGDVDMSEFDPEVLISEEDMKRIIEDYANIVYSSIETVEIAKGEDVEVAGKDYSFNIMEYELTEEELYDILLEVLETAADDDAIADMVDGLGYDYDEIIDEAIDTIETAKEDASDDNYVEGRVYVDARGVIMGREYTFYADDEESAVFYYILGADGDDVCFEMSMEADGEEAMVVEFSRIGEDLEGSVVIEGEEMMTVEGSYKDEAYSGTFTIISEEYDWETDDYEEVEVSVEFENLKTVGDNNEYISGKIIFDMEEFADEEELAEMDVTSIEIILESDGKGQDVTVAFGELLSITVGAAVNEGEVDIDIPSGSDDVYDIETEAEAYLETVEYEAVIDKVLELLGLDDEFTTEEIIESIESGMTAEDDYYDDYYDDDYYEDDYYEDDYYEDDYYEDDYYEDDSDEYDYNWDYVDLTDNLVVNAFGTDYAWPCTMEPFCAYFGLDGKIAMTADDWDYAYSDGGSEIDFYNPYDYDVDTQECFVEYIFVSEDDSDFLITVNGVGIGATVADINDAFGTEFNEDMLNGELEVEDSYYYDELYFYIADGVVTHFEIEVDDDTVDEFIAGNGSDENDTDVDAEEDIDVDAEEDDNIDDEFVGGDSSTFANFDTVSVTVNGIDCGFTEMKAVMFADYFTIDSEEVVTSGDWNFAYSESTYAYVCYENWGDEECSALDCVISCVYLDEYDAGFDFTVNGIGIGSTVAELGAVFACPFDASCVTVYNEADGTDSDIYIVFDITDGIITGMSCYNGF